MAVVKMPSAGSRAVQPSGEQVFRERRLERLRDRHVRGKVASRGHADDQRSSWRAGTVTTHPEESPARAGLRLLRNESCGDRQTPTDPNLRARVSKLGPALPED